MAWSIIRSKSLSIARATARSMSTADPRIVKAQKKFQVDVEKPVFLMGGTKDKVLCSLTAAMVIVGLGQCFYLLVDMANPKK